LIIEDKVAEEVSLSKQPGHHLNLPSHIGYISIKTFGFTNFIFEQHGVDLGISPQMGIVFHKRRLRLIIKLYALESPTGKMTCLLNKHYRF